MTLIKDKQKDMGNWTYQSKLVPPNEGEYSASNKNNSNMARHLYEQFQGMKIGDMCGHLQLVSYI